MSHDHILSMASTFVNMCLLQHIFVNPISVRIAAALVPTMPSCGDSDAGT